MPYPSGAPYRHWDNAVPVQGGECSYRWNPNSPYPVCYPYNSPSTSALDTQRPGPSTLNSPPQPSTLHDKNSQFQSFYLRQLQGSRIRQCYGCNSAIRRDLTFVPSQPHDIVICHKECRYYRDGDCMKLTGSDQPVHYHFMQQCVKNKHPSFIPTMLYISPEIKPLLTATHIAHLCDEFGIIL